MAVAVGIMRSSRARGLRLALVALLVAVCTACGSGNGVELSGIFRPDGTLPVKLSLGVNGYTISGSAGIVTPVGEFSIGGHYNLQPPPQHSIYVLLRNRTTGFDQVFNVLDDGSQLTVVINGQTVISVTKDQVLIDVTSGSIKEITFKRASNAVAEKQGGGLFSGIAHRWDEGWAQSWYKPYAMTRWAFDDSTIQKWWGVGFVWFLLRLIAAVILFVVDTILFLFFFVGQLFFLLFGPTGRDVFYGLVVLGFLALGVRWWSEEFL